MLCGRRSVHQPEITEDLIYSLLGPVEDHKVYPIENVLTGEVLLVTGAGGFIGSRLCQRIASYGPKTLVLVEQSEFNLYEVHRKLQFLFPDLNVVPILGNCGDWAHMRTVLTTFRPDTVYHVAAYKHVPLVERNPLSAMQNNVVAADTLFELCSVLQVPEVVVVSSDKAVNPTNVMGASKRMVEFAAHARLEDRVRCVRFGNVLWSSGSVLPLFYEQLKSSLPVVTLTHLDVTRYFMSVQQAVGLILESQFCEGRTFVFDMGSPVRIYDMVHRLACALGVSSYEVEVVGLRPGEKLYEELTLGQGLVPTVHPSILAAQEPVPGYNDWLNIRTRVDHALHAADVDTLRSLLLDVVPGYAPACGIVDDLYLQRHILGIENVLDDCFRPTRKVKK